MFSNNTIIKDTTNKTKVNWPSATKKLMSKAALTIEIIVFLHLLKITAYGFK